jgi:hypothetical protein
MITDGVAPARVFSNERAGSHTPTAVIETGAPLDPTRYNTEWIDTRHELGGREYYVALRAMAVGQRCISVFVRARPVQDGDASVHNSDTPLDPMMWNFFYERLVVPNRKTIQTLCERIASVLGLGFYAHDLLPDRTVGELLVCETGFKFDDVSYRQHFWPLRGQLMAEEFLTTEFPIRSAEAFCEQLRHTA